MGFTSETDGKRIFLWLQLEKFNHLDNYALIELRVREIILHTRKKKTPTCS